MLINRLFYGLKTIIVKKLFLLIASISFLQALCFKARLSENDNATELNQVMQKEDIVLIDVTRLNNSISRHGPVIPYNESRNTRQASQR